MKTFIILFFLVLTLNALNLNGLIQNALDKNPSLEAIQYRIQASKTQTNSSNQFSNPTLSISDNTLSSSVAMNKSTISLSQKISFYGKREALENVALANENILNESLEMARIDLVETLKTQAYRLWELKELYKIIEEYEHITKQNIELFESYTATSDNQHMGIMSAELTLSDLRIQKAVLEAHIQESYAKLSYLAAVEVNDLDISLVVWDLPSKESFQEGLINNKRLTIQEKEIQKNQALIETADLNNYPDVNLLASYAYRENFDNFLTFGIGMSLPIYGTEDNEEEGARALALSANSLKKDITIEVNSEFKTAYAQMKSAYVIYHIVQDEAIPQIDHMFELMNSSISTGGDLFKYIDILVQRLHLEQKSIASVTLYNTSMAKIEALSGEMD